MKNKIFIVALILFAGIIGLNAQPKIELRDPTKVNELKNPTINNEFNTNTTPFDEKRIEGLRENYNRFGYERQNISIKSGSYEHYNQAGRQQSLINNQENIVVNRPQSATLNSTPNNYGNQNANRVVGNATGNANVRYNAPMSVEQIKATKKTTTTDEEIVETGDKQNISLRPGNEGGGVVDPGVLPERPVPVSDAIPFIVMLAGLYAFIIRRKQ